MKELALARHGHAEPFESEAGDFQRPLTRRGLLDVAAVGGRLSLTPWRPELIIASSARRTQQTARSLAQVFGIDETAVVTEPRLYQANFLQWQKIVRELPAANKILLVGHNPGVSDFAHWLAPDTAVTGFTPGTIIRFDLAIADWTELAPAQVLRQIRAAARQRPRD